MRARSGIVLTAALAALPAACASRPAFPVDGARMHARVAHQVAQGPRVPGTPGHAAVRAWLVAELERLGARVEQQAFVDTSLGRPLPLVNVIAHFGPERVAGQDTNHRRRNTQGAGDFAPGMIRTITSPCK